MAQPQVAVVIPTYDRRELLRSTLSALAEQTCAPDLFEVIVADDGSTDGTGDMVKSFKGLHRLSYIAQPDLGYRPAAARNAGARLATAPVLAFVDAGAMPGPGFIEATARAHAGGDVAVIGYMYAYGADEPRSAALVAEHGLLGAVQRMRAEGLLRDPRHGQFAAVEFDLGRMLAPWVLFWSGNVSVSARRFHEAGGFDEAFRSWGGEDLELGLRLAHLGVRFTASDEAWIVELPHPRPSEQQKASNLANIALMHDKHTEPACELLWAILASGVFAPLEQAYRELLDWREAARADDDPAALAKEIERALAAVPEGARIAVVGAGSWRPGGAAGAGLRGPGGQRHPYLADFDPRWCSPTGANPAVKQVIGLRTGLGNDSADVVVITSRLRGLWPRWGSALRAEAKRIGADVRVTIEH